MKKGSKTKWGFFLAVVLVFLAGQAVGEAFLCEGEVTGTVVEISDGVPAYIVVDPGDGSADLEFKGIPVEYLENFLAAEFEDPDLTLLSACVTISYHECPGLDIEDETLKACSIGIIEITDCASDADATADAEAIVTFELPLRRGQFYRVPHPPQKGGMPPAPQNGAGGGYRGRRGP
jgi:hypothetical protein